MEFWDHMFFVGASHALRQVLKEDQGRKKRLAQHQPQAETTPKANINAADKVDAMIFLAGQMIEAADRACGTQVEFTAKDVVTMLIGAVLFQAVDGCAADTADQIAVYDFAVDFCKLDGACGGEVLFPSEGNELAQSMDSFADELMKTIVLASVHGNCTQRALDFMTMFAGLTLEIDAAMAKNFPHITFPTETTSLVLEKGRLAIEALSK